MGGATTIIGLSALHLQSLALLSDIDLPWPAAWDRVAHYVKLANLDPTRFLDRRGLPEVTFHTLYILFANLLPMLIALAGLVLFQPTWFVFWYSTFAAGLSLLGVGLIMRYGVAGDGIDTTAAWWYVVGGGALAFTCAVIGVVGYFVRHVNDDEREDEAARVRREQRLARAQALAFDGPRSLSLLLIAGLCFLSGCLLTGLFVQIPGTTRQTGVLHVLGFVLFGVAIVSALKFVTSLTAASRKFVLKVESFIKRNALLGLLLLVSVTYVPTIDYCVASFMCAEYTCPSGFVFNPRAPREAGSFTRSEALFCDPCVFRDARCRADGGTLYRPTPAPTSARGNQTGNGTSLTVGPASTAPGGGVADSGPPTYDETVQAYCPEFRERRVWRYPEVSCSDPSLKYFYVSSGIVLACYVLLVPVLYVRLIRRITAVLHENALLIPESPEDNVEMLAPPAAYNRQVYAVEPAAASLYQPFTIFHRYFTITLLVFRMLLVVLAGIIAPYSADGALYGLLMTHVCALGSLLYLKPFNERVEGTFAIALEACSIVNSGIAVAIFHGVELPGEVVYVLFATNVVIPVLAAVFTFRFVRDRTRKKKREAHERALREGSESPSGSPRAGDGPALSVPLVPVPDARVNDDEEPGSPRTLVRPASKYKTLSMRVRSRGLSGVSIPKIKMPTPAEEARMHDENAQLLDGLNRETAEMVTSYFAALGLLLLIATGASALGYLRGTTTAFVDGSTYAARGPMPVLAGYDSFEEMASSCCCIESAHPAAAYNTTERWLCPARGVTVDRARRDFDLVNNGLPVRPVCGGPTSLNFGCAITVNDTRDGRHVLLSCPGVTAEQWRQLGVSAEARQLLF